MDLHNVSTFTKAETILNNPGKFFFQITEDNEIKMSNIPIHKKNVDLIKTNIQLIFKKISENLKQISHIDIDYYGDVISKLEKYSNTSFSFRFPGLQVKSLGNPQLDVISQFPDRVLICEKSDGVRFLLIQFTNDKTLFLGRNMEFFIVDLTASLPKNTNFKKNEWDIEHFLDGELIIDKSTKRNIIKNHVMINNTLHEVNFLVFDAVVLSGVNIGHMKFKNRLQELSNFFKKIKFQRFMEDAKEKFMSCYDHLIDKSIKYAMNNTLDNNYNKSKKFSISLYMKDYFTFDKIEFLFSKICKNLNHDNDGIILNLDDYPYYSGAANEIFKWKPARLNTVDFELTLEKPSQSDRRLYVLNVNESRDKLIPMSCLFFETKEEELKFLNEYEEIRLSPNRIIVECYYDNNFNTDETINFNMMNHYEIIRKKNHLYLNNYDFNFIEDKRKSGINLVMFNTGAWKFLRFRRDKQQSNHISVFLNIWETITENLSIEKIISKIKNNAGKVSLPNNQVLTTLLKNKIDNKLEDDENFIGKKRKVDSVLENKSPNKFNKEIITSSSALQEVIIEKKIEVKEKKKKDNKQEKLSRMNQSLDIALNLKSKEPNKPNTNMNDSDSLGSSSESELFN